MCSSLYSLFMLHAAQLIQQIIFSFDNDSLFLANESQVYSVSAVFGVYPCSVLLAQYKPSVVQYKYGVLCGLLSSCQTYFALELTVFAIFKLLVNIKSNLYFSVIHIQTHHLKFSCFKCRSITFFSSRFHLYLPTLYLSNLFRRLLDYYRGVRRATCEIVFPRSSHSFHPHSYGNAMWAAIWIIPRLVFLLVALASWISYRNPENRQNSANRHQN